MNEIIKEIKARRAYRALDTKEIPEDAIERIMTAATLAPSCANKQPWRFLAIREEKLLEKVKGAISERNYWAFKSPFIVVVCTKAEYDCQLPDKRDYAYFGTGMAVSNMMLQGVSEGLYTHPIAGFEPSKMRQALGIPEDVVVLTVVMFAYPGDPSTLNDKHLAGETADQARKPMDEVVTAGSWPESWG